MVMMNTLDLSSCDREQIQHITRIQGHGAFLTVHLVDHKIRNASDNLSAFFGQASDSSMFVGRRLQDLLSLDLATRLQKGLRSEELYREGMEVVLENNQKLEIHVFRINSELAGIEFESLSEDEDSSLNAMMVSCLEIMQKGKSLEEVSEVACKAVRALSGFERVMIYRFFPPDMYGEVIAEDRIASAHSFLHHRFPATDIPKPARELYLRNKVRYIHDANAPTFEIKPPVYDRKTPLDLSDSRLRAVSLIHIDYLKNMGVRGSMSVAIIVKGELWGIISCHHSAVKFVSQKVRRLCLQVASTLAIVAPLIEGNTKFSQENNFSTHLHSFFDEIKLDPDPFQSLFRKVGKLTDLFSSTGMACVTAEKVTSGGLTPRSSDLRLIWEWIKTHMKGEVFEETSLSTLAPQFEHLKELISGVLAIKISPTDDSLFIFMRPEILQNVMWGGDPRKNLSERNYGGTINPRASFETWTEVIKGSALPWEKFERQGIINFRNLVFDSLVRKEQLIQELHSRLKA